MVYSLTYRRPRRVESMENRDSYGLDRKSSTISGSSSIPIGIPEALSFEKIIAGGTCPPCTVRDFMNYLLYIERAPENLQFYLWLQGYVKRFGAATTSDIALAPEWTDAMQDAAMEESRRKSKTPLGLSVASTAATMFKGTDFASSKDKPITVEHSNPFSDPPGSPNEKHGDLKKPWDVSFKKIQNSTFNSQESSMHTRSAESYQTTASEAFSTAGLKQPFTIQPFREEVNRVIATYVVKDSPRELNISSRERYAILKALQYTTHPSAFSHIASTTESSLRTQNHPNFIRWTICNGNRPRVIFARGLGISCILLGLLSAILITLSSAPRGFRAISAILWILGISTLVAAWKGMCVVLHGLHHRHLRPWELFEDPEVEMSKDDLYSGFGPDVKSYEDEPWVIRYKKRNIIRKVFDKEVWVQEPALRQIQDTIFLQAVLSGVAVGIVLIVIFVVVPKGSFY